MNTSKTLKGCGLWPKGNDGGDAVEQDLVGSRDSAAPAGSVTQPSQPAAVLLAGFRIGKT